MIFSLRQSIHHWEACGTGGRKEQREKLYSVLLSWVGWVGWRNKTQTWRGFSILKKKKKADWKGNGKFSTNNNKNLNTCTYLFEFLPPSYLLSVAFLLKHWILLNFMSRDDRLCSFLVISEFWHGPTSCAYEFQCSIKLSEGVLSRAEMISPSFVLCWAFSRYYPWTDKGSILQQRSPGWQRGDTAAPLCDYPRSAGRVQGLLIRIEPRLHFLGLGVQCGSKEICLAFSLAVFLVVT